MFKNKSIILLLIIINVTAIISCAQEKNNNSDNEKKINITVEELTQKMKSDSNLVLLDVRTPPELNGPLGHIKGVINIPVQVLDQRLNELNKYKGKEIIVICRSGNRSKVATNILRENGFNAINVLGGMRAYNKMKQKKVNK